MKKLLFVARRLDAHAKQLLAALPTRGFATHVLGAGPAGAGEAAAMEAQFAQAAPLADVIYLLLESDDADFAALGWDYAAHRGKLVVDLARCSANRAEPAAGRFLERWRPMAVARHLRQTRGPAGETLPLETLLAADYLAYSFMPKSLLSDLGWFLRKASGDRAGQRPPSAMAAELLAAPADDQRAREAAVELLAQEPGYPPALMRLALEAASRSGAVPAQLDPSKDADPLTVFSLLALGRHMAPGSENARQIAKIAEHVWGPPADGQKGKRILLLVVYKQRDLFIDLILRYHLERLGHRVIMRSLGDDPAASLVELLPDVVIWGAKTTPYQVQLARFARDRNIVSIVRREEAGTARKRWDQLSPTVRKWSLGNIDYAPLVDLELVFGQDFAEILREEGHMPPDRCQVVGAMTFDPYFLPELSRFMPGRGAFCRQLGLDPAKKIMLLLTPWTYADRDPGAAIPEAKGAAADDGATAEIQRTMALHKDGRRGWLEFLEALYHDKGRDWNLILKVHPGERAEAYGEFFRARGLDIKLVVSGYVVEMLNHADLLVHAGSTTAIEAHFLGKPSLAYWVKAPQNSPIYQLTPHANSFEEFEALFQGLDLTRGNADEAVIASLEKDLYGRMDGQACLRAARIIDEFLAGRPTRPFRHLQDKVVGQPRRSDDPYGTNITPQEIDYYYPMVKQCLDAKEGRPAPSPRPGRSSAGPAAPGAAAGQSPASEATGQRP